MNRCTHPLWMLQVRAPRTDVHGALKINWKILAWRMISYRNPFFCIALHAWVAWCIFQFHFVLEKLNFSMFRFLSNVRRMKHSVVRCSTHCSVDCSSVRYWCSWGHLIFRRGPENQRPKNYFSFSFQKFTNEKFHQGLAYEKSTNRTFRGSITDRVWSSHRPRFPDQSDATRPSIHSRLFSNVHVSAAPW